MQVLFSDDMLWLGMVVRTVIVVVIIVVRMKVKINRKEYIFYFSMIMRIVFN
jgi:hypothetical protein